MDTMRPLPDPVEGHPGATFNLVIARDAPDVEWRVRAALRQTGLHFRLVALSTPVDQFLADAAAAPLPHPPTPAGGGTQAAVRPQTLLLVDDEYNILSALRRVLRREGYRILAATSGDQGLALLADNEVDVIVADQRMPSMTGIEFLRRARALHPDSVRIVLSGYSEFQSIADAINEGAIYRFLSKPWEDKELVAHLREAFNHKAVLDHNRQLQRELAATNAAMSSANTILHSLLTEEQARGDRGEATLAVIREILQSLPLPILGIDVKDQIVLSNDAAARLFADVSLLGAGMHETLPPAMLAAVEAADADTAVEYGGRAYTVSLHAMGARSQSRGRLLVFNPVPPTPPAVGGRRHVRATPPTLAIETATVPS